MNRYIDRETERRRIEDEEARKLRIPVPSYDDRDDQQKKQEPDRIEFYM